MRTLNFKRQVEKLSGDFRISAGDAINTPQGQQVVPARVGLLEDVAIRNIDVFRGKNVEESRTVFNLGKKIKSAAGNIQVDDQEFEYLEKVYSAQIAPVVESFFAMVEELNPV